MTKVLVLFSGGLDSLLAVKILQKQGLKVEGICFTSNFFDCKKARTIAERHGIKIHIRDIGNEMINLVKSPSEGFGKNLNPCVDCHALMIKIAGSFAKKKGFEILATGEVLGQRPFSQNRKALEKVADKSGFEVLRPLSAKLLKQTLFEKRGLVNRNKLLDIQGRSREAQTKLIEEWGISDYESPAGGCLLTDPGFSSRLEQMKEKIPDFDYKDVELLKWGRIFWFSIKGSPVLLVVGRNEEENNKLEQLAGREDIIIKTQSVTGPIGLLRSWNVSTNEMAAREESATLKIPEKLNPKGEAEKENKTLKEIIKKTMLLVGWFSVKGRGEEIKFLFYAS
ncbi:MAG: tRNA 4-thiouridine(8) synthase ThiI [Candidatus Moraniibacteriota bacterium]